MGVECNAKCKCVDCENGKPGEHGGAPWKGLQVAEAFAAHSSLFDDDRQDEVGSSSVRATTLETLAASPLLGFSACARCLRQDNGPRDATMAEPYDLLEMHTLMCNEEQIQVTGHSS